MGFAFISIADQNMNSQHSLPLFPLPHPLIPEQKIKHLNF